MNRYELSVNLLDEVETYEGTKLIQLGFEDEMERVKVFENECPTFKHIMVYDIKIAGTDENEKYVYSFSPDLQYNLRKGHTIVEIYDPNNFDLK